MPQIVPLPGVGKISRRFQVLIVLGILSAVCFYFPEEHASQSLADWCQEWVGILIWAPLGVLVASFIAFGIWTTFCIRCPKCGGRIRAGHLSERRTVLYPCARCDILWDSQIEQRETSSSSN